MTKTPVEDLSARKPRPNRQNGYRWDEIGGYIVSTIRLPETFAMALGAVYETLVYAMTAGQWDVDGSGVHSKTEVEANAAHDETCDRIRRGQQ